MNNTDYTFKEPGQQGYHEVTNTMTSTATASQGSTVTRVTVTFQEEIQGSTTEEVILHEVENNKETKIKRERKAFYSDLIAKVVTEHSSLEQEDVTGEDGGDGERAEGAGSSGDLRSDELSLEESC